MKRNVLISFVLLIAGVTHAQYTPEQLKAAYIFNFAENIRWPNEGSRNSFIIGILGHNEKIINDLNDFAADEKIKNKPITITASDSVDDLITSNILFIPRVNNQNIKSIFEKIKGKNLLAVTEAVDDKKYVMINLIPGSDNTIRFELNEKNIIEQDLSVLPDMILLGGTTIDLHELYKESQRSLLTKEEQIAEQQQQLDKLSSDLERITLEAERQRNLITKQTAEIFDKQNRLDLKIKQLDSLTSEIEQQRQQLADQQALLDEQVEIQNRQQLEINSKKTELEEYTRRLKNKYEEVDRLETEIDEKQSILDKQNVTIATQQNILYIMILIILLVLSLIFLIYRGLRNKKIANRKLEEKNRHIEEQRLELERSYKQLKELEDFKETMTDMIVHDLKNPLNSIIGLSRDECSKSDLKVINESGKKMLKLVTEILDIHKFEESKFPLDIQNLPVSNAVVESINEVSVQLNASSIDLKNKVPDQLTAKYDLEIISRVLMNLLTNSIKYTPAGGEIEIQAEHEDNIVRVLVSDTGQGIPESKITTLFDKFSQLKKKKYGTTSSTGLGLAFCKLAVEAHGGMIGVESEPEKGSTFWFTLPSGDEDKVDDVDSLPDIAHIGKLKNYGFSEADKITIKEIFPRLRKCKVFEYGKISDILEDLDENISESVEDWKNDIINSVFANNNIRFGELTSDEIFTNKSEE
ncbi:MAG: DUF4154 domain-containing protein [Melioribacteraceae bacterium]|nr:DUF4154 domain-containing protein [Melioribacteraceae bacterium]